MSRSLPARPDLDQLRRRAKELRDAAQAGEPAARNRFAAHVSADSPITLATAQLVVAREYGFVSWPRLKAAIDVRAAPDLAASVDAFLAASIDNQPRRAATVLARDRRIATYDISTAAVLGDVAHVRDLVAADPSAAIAPDARRGWSPLLYACHSCWHRVDAELADGILHVVWTLLDTGASANSNNGLPSRSGYRSAIYGAAGIADNAPVTSLLLRYGADPNDDESLYHAAMHPDRACLRVLLGHGATVNGTNAFAAAIAPDNAEGVRLMIEAGGDPGRPRPAGAAKDGHLADRSLSPLPLAVVECGVDVVEQLLAAGADPNAPGTDHRSPIRRATRRGNADVARLLARHGAVDDTTEVDRFLGACLRGDRGAVRQLLRRSPDLFARCTDVDKGALADAAEYGTAAAVRLMVDLGFPVGVRRNDGATPLHAAAYAGRVMIVEQLLAAGADVNAPDGNWGSTALAWATVGSGERPRYAVDADWTAVVRVLVNAGTTTDDAWIGGKRPGEDVAAVLGELGIAEPDDSEE